MPWDIGGWELFVIAVVTIVVVGPKELPVLLRTVGQWMAKARSMARDFQRSFEQLARESELEQLRKDLNELKANNPVSELKRDLEKTIGPAVDTELDEFAGFDPSATSGRSPSPPKAVIAADDKPPSDRDREPAATGTKQAGA